MKKQVFQGFIAATLALGLSAGAPVQAQGQFQNELRHDRSICSGNGPAVWINVTDISVSEGKLRIQLYPGTSADWLESGRWLNRIEIPARAGSVTVCMPVPRAGTYAIAIRHDVNGNGRTDLRSDGGGMSNNPSINIFNLGKPSVSKTRFSIGREVKPMSIRMRYL